MKKTIIAIGMLATVAVSSSFGQGTVGFGNGNTTKISTNSVMDGVATGTMSANIGNTAPGTQNFYFALFYSTSQTSVGGNAAAVLGTAGTYAFNAVGWVNGTPTLNVQATNAANGRFQQSSPNSDGSTSVAGLTAGAAAQFVIIGWSANIGNSIAALSAWLANPNVSGWAGQSMVSGSITSGILGSSPAPGLVGTAAGLINPFSLGLVTVPEPGTLALAALGGASLLMFRRKNK